MKKIDLHIHTIPTFRDSPFDFSLQSFKRYIEEAQLNAIAITNHDVFDVTQYITIKESLTIPVFPGIEVCLENGHILVITDANDLSDFNKKTNLVSQKIKKVEDFLSLYEFKTIFGNLGKYLLIPHYEKYPSIHGDTLKELLPHLSAGEVDSAKKFLRIVKDDGKLIPVLFSDVRISDDLNPIPVRQTYIDCGEVSLAAIKHCLKDKNKVSLSEKDGNKLWRVFPNGQHLSTGLNVLVGERSTGKTYTLDQISKCCEKVKYIKQFSLVQQNDESYEREFNSDVQRKRSTIIDQYLAGFKIVLDDVMNVDLAKTEKRIDQYLSTLLRSAEEASKRDSFSKSALFDEVEFPINQIKTLFELINSVRQVIENVEYRSTIERHVDLASLKALACELIEMYWERSLESKKRKTVNEWVKEIKQRLKMKTSAIQIEDVDLYKASIDIKKVERFDEIVSFLKKKSVISQENIQGFRVEAKKEAFTGAGEIKEVSGVRTGFKDPFKEYSNPYNYLQLLLEKEDLSKSDLYKLFVKISYQILNKDGSPVSGGERSEFRLLQEIKDAQNHDLLLIDEPESSFDNLFLKTDVNQILKEISKSMPVVIVTHNNTVGASVGADYLLYAEKTHEGGKVVYRLYSGHPTDKFLEAVDGNTINNHDVQLNSLEAGYEAYVSRKSNYEAIKDR